MLQVIVEVLTNLNIGFQIMGVILIGFKIILAFGTLNFLNPNSDSQLRFLASEGIISIILISLNLVLAIIAANKLISNSVRKYAALILLGISQLIICIVVIFSIAGAVVTNQLYNPPNSFVPPNYFYVLNIVIILYYSFFVFLSQSLLMGAVGVLVLRDRK